MMTAEEVAKQMGAPVSVTVSSKVKERLPTLLERKTLPLQGLAGIRVHVTDVMPDDKALIIDADGRLWMLDLKGS